MAGPITCPFCDAPGQAGVCQKCGTSIPPEEAVHLYESMWWDQHLEEQRYAMPLPRDVIVPDGRSAANKLRRRSEQSKPSTREPPCPR